MKLHWQSFQQSGMNVWNFQFGNNYIPVLIIYDLFKYIIIFLCSCSFSFLISVYVYFTMYMHLSSHSPSLFRTWLSLCGPTIIIQTFMVFLQRLLSFAGPLLLQAILVWLVDPTAPTSEGYAYEYNCIEV